MGKAQRRKGHDWEREVAASLQSLDPSARRLLEYQAGAGVDIKTTLPVAIQCKCGRSLAVGLSGLKEAQAAAAPGVFPICAFKPDRRGSFAVLSWEDFIDMLGGYLRRDDR